MNEEKERSDDFENDFIEEGYLAGLKGSMSLIDNPYQAGTQSHEEWELGRQMAILEN
jgi:hypothetical protein